MDHLAASRFQIYLAETKRPFTALAFALPLIVLYEIGAITLLGETSADSPLIARTLIASLLSLFGVVGLHLPAVLLVAVLLAQHLMTRERWRTSPKAVLGMWLESCVWALPFLVLGGVLGVVGFGSFEGSRIDPAAGATLALGAGLYEEFVFRMLLMLAVHALLTDVCGVRRGPADVMAVIASAVAFAAYHGQGDSGVNAAAVFYLASGLLLGWLYLVRGFGIAAGAHTAYDLVVLALLPALLGGVSEGS